MKRIMTALFTATLALASFSSTQATRDYPTLPPCPAGTITEINRQQVGGFEKPGWVATKTCVEIE